MFLYARPKTSFKIEKSRLRFTNTKLMIRYFLKCGMASRHN